MGDFVTIVLTSSVIAGMVTFALNLYREDRNIKREKLEKLYMSASKWIMGFGLFAVDWERAMKGALTADDVRRIWIEKGEDQERSFEHMHMLIGVYFPSLIDNLQELMDCRKSIVAIIQRFEHKADAGDPDGSEFLRDCDKHMRELDSIENRFRNAMYDEGQAINKPWKNLLPRRLTMLGDKR